MLRAGSRDSVQGSCHPRGWEDVADPWFLVAKLYPLFHRLLTPQGKAVSLVPVSCVLQGNWDPMASQEWYCDTAA